VEELHGLHHSAEEIATSAPPGAIDVVSPRGQTMPESNHSREVLLTFDGSKVRGQEIMLDSKYRE